MARVSPALPLIGGGRTRFQPVFAGDVAQAVVASLEGRAQGGQIYELGGPNVCSFRELMEFVLATIERKRLLVDNVVSENAKREGRTLEKLGIDPVAMASVAPSYLWRFRRAGQFAEQTDDRQQTTEGGA